MKFGHFLACLFVHGRGFFRQGMHTAMDVGVIDDGKNHPWLRRRKRFLGGGGGIEIDQRNARAHFPLQDRKIFANIG